MAVRSAKSSANVAPPKRSKRSLMRSAKEMAGPSASTSGEPSSASAICEGLQQGTRAFASRSGVRVLCIKVWTCR